MATPFRIILLPLVLLIALLGAVAFFFWPGGKGSIEEQSTVLGRSGQPAIPAGINQNLEKSRGSRKRADFGFREAAQESGITFRMQFLPGEQGEKFKINLYDHGRGVAAGDLNGYRFNDN